MDVFLIPKTQLNTVVDKMNSFSQQHSKDCNCHFIWFGSGHFEHTSKSLLHSKDRSRTVFLVCTVLAGGPKQARFLEAPDNCLTQPRLFFLPTVATASSRSFFLGRYGSFQRSPKCLCLAATFAWLWNQKIVGGRGILIWLLYDATIVYCLKQYCVD